MMYYDATGQDAARAAGLDSRSLGAKAGVGAPAVSPTLTRTRVVVPTGVQPSDSDFGAPAAVVYSKDEWKKYTAVPGPLDWAGTESDRQLVIANLQQGWSSFVDMYNAKKADGAPSMSFDEWKSIISSYKNKGPMLSTGRKSWTVSNSDDYKLTMALEVSKRVTAAKKAAEEEAKVEAADAKAKAKKEAQQKFKAAMSKADSAYALVGRLTGMTLDEYEQAKLDAGFFPVQLPGQKPFKSGSEATALVLFNNLNAIYQAALKAPQGHTLDLLTQAKVLQGQANLSDAQFQAQADAARGNKPWEFKTAQVLLSSIKGLIAKAPKPVVPAVTLITQVPKVVVPAAPLMTEAPPATAQTDADAITALITEAMGYFVALKTKGLLTDADNTKLIAQFGGPVWTLATATQYRNALKAQHDAVSAPAAPPPPPPPPPSGGGGGGGGGGFEPGLAPPAEEKKTPEIPVEVTPSRVKPAAPAAKSTLPLLAAAGALTWLLLKKK